MKTLENAMDEAGFELISKHQPAVIAEIEKALDGGETAKRIEKAIFKRFGKTSLTAALVAGAAHYMEKQRKQEKPQ